VRAKNKDNDGKAFNLTRAFAKSRHPEGCEIHLVLISGFHVIA
jgi:hypothetical protein